MKNIVDETGEIIAKATDDHTLIGGHHRLAVAASLGQKLFWRDTGEPVKLDPFFKHHGSSLDIQPEAAHRAYRCSGTSRWSSSRSRCLFRICEWPGKNGNIPVAVFNIIQTARLTCT